MKKHIIKTVILSAAMLSLTPGCATNTGDPAKDRAGRVTNVVLDKIAGLAESLTAQYLASGIQSGFDSDWAYSLAKAAELGALSNINSTTFKQLADAWNPQAPALNTQLAGLVATATTPTDAQAISSSIATGVAAAAAKANP